MTSTVPWGADSATPGRSWGRAIKAERLALEFQVPMIFLQGELDAFAVSADVEHYVAKIQSPHKAYIGIPGAGHSPWMMPGYLELLRMHVRPIFTLKH
jgi:pimeloyl-ACP methyl ester carboxylesterase